MSAAWDRKGFAIGIVTGLTGLVVVVSVATADAQIYSWHTDDGTLVLSDQPQTSEATTVNVAGADHIRTTRVVAPTHEPARYDALIRHHAGQHGVRPELVRAVIQVESGFDPNARSAVGAMGLMQLMPKTALHLGVDHPFDPSQNIRGGIRYLGQLLTRYDGDETLALAAYNAGPGAVRRYGNQVPPCPETLGYLERVGAESDRGRPAPPDGSNVTIYKTYETVDGRRVPMYSDTPPESGNVEVTTSDR